MSEEAKPGAKPKSDATPNLEARLPLVLEIVPGQAREGLVEMFPPGSYETKDVADLVESVLGKENMSVEERQVLNDVRKQLHGGKLLYNGQEVKGNYTAYATEQTTEQGEKYRYVVLKAIKPQEGGRLY